MMRKFKSILKLLVRNFIEMSTPVLRMIFPRVNFEDLSGDTQWRVYRWCISSFWQRNILRLAPTYPFPCHLTCIVSNPENIFFDQSCLGNFQSPGTYYQCFSGRIYLGKGCMIAPNVGLITSNHDLSKIGEEFHLPSKDIKIGDGCWVGMNAVILPGVELPPRTTVGAGAVVTKGLKEEGRTLVGVPAICLKMQQTKSVAQ